ncbi:carbon-nitrogen hydrolase [Radiomyces spectabilis]|uniref:carbon-nitrogen hydrolase n=1 Tax=Radiomyces spectabilis TaxID=64574 RepID=UPI00221F5E7E|nr:carbon-nitrogen hydrolase [Radiomyces spectabilis]KAI8375963.1 carbon-nitrogen hydrolase [Radiomyces spectabilis]
MLAAVAQFCATSGILANKQICSQLATDAARQGAKMVFLPEASDFIASSKEEALDLTTSLEASPLLQGLQQVAQEQNIWISVGVHEKSDKLTHIYNTHVVIDDLGKMVSTYRKIHLFNVDIKDGPRLMESDSTLAGQTIYAPLDTPLGRVGLQICYDVRFAELSITQRQRGAQILTFPSAFTVKTGMAHWEPLLRARAIETQTYVIAAAQIGQHNAKRASFGNAMIIDPWGTVLARCADSVKPTLALALIDLDYLEKIRLEMPVLNHRRNDLYPKLA